MPRVLQRILLFVGDVLATIGNAIAMLATVVTEAGYLADDGDGAGVTTTGSPPRACTTAT